MNRFQKVVLFGGAITVLLLCLFPPYDLIGLGRGAPVFDAFYPMFAVPTNRVINGDVLYLLVFGVLINAGLAWLLLASSREAPGEPRFDEQAVVVLFGIANLVIVLLFPPMEAFPFAQRITVGTFDGFYFAFGDKSRRSIFVPLLYMEVLFVLTSACAFWLAMSIARRTHSAEVGTQVTFAPAAPVTSVSKRGPERRRGHDAAFRGPEKRSRAERRRAAARQA